MTDTASRQSFLGPEAPIAFQDQVIGIIGLCGGGSHIAQQLAHIGFQRFILCDFDHVEKSNLTRMIGSCPSDAAEAKKKTFVINRMIHNIHPDADVRICENRWQEHAQTLRQCSVIFGCVDSLGVRDELERFCRRYLIAYIDIGMDVHQSNAGFSISGQVALSLPNHPCMRCMNILREDMLAKEQQQYGAAGGRPQVVWPNGVLASAAIGQYMSLILPWNKDQNPALLLEYDGNKQTCRESIKLQYLAEHVCNHFPLEQSLGDPFFSFAL